MKIYFIIVSTIGYLLCNSLLAYSHNDSFTPEDTLKRLHYDFVYKAESFIMENNIDSALWYYLKGVDFKNRYGIDRYNMGVCFSSSSDEPLKIKVLITSFFNLPDSITYDYFISLMSDRLSAEGIAILKDSIVGKQKKIDNDDVDYLKLSAIIERLELDDQRHRGAATPLKRKTMKSLDLKNLKKLKRLYRKYGKFYTNKLLGKAMMGYTMIVIHNFHNQKTYRKNNAFFVNEVLHGRLDAREYAFIVDNYRFDSTQVYGEKTTFICNDTLVVYRLTQKGLDKFNKNRSKIYLDDINTMHKKAIWQYQHNDKFRFVLTNEITPISPDQTVESIARYYQGLMADLVDGYELFTR